MSQNEKYTKRTFPQGILPLWIGYRKSVQSSTRDPESAFPHQQPAGFLTCRSTPTAAFPVFPVTVPRTLAIRSLLTVTSSYRTYTCFPFTRCPHRTPFPVSERILARFPFTSYRKRPASCDTAAPSAYSIGFYVTTRLLKMQGGFCSVLCLLNNSSVYTRT